MCPNVCKTRISGVLDGSGGTEKVKTRQVTCTLVASATEHAELCFVCGDRTRCSLDDWRAEPGRRAEVPHPYLTRAELAELVPCLRTSATIATGPSGLRHPLVTFTEDDARPLNEHFEEHVRALPPLFEDHVQTVVRVVGPRHIDLAPAAVLRTVECAGRTHP
jgi:hypothetical protein